MYNQACVCDIKSTKDLEPEESLLSSSAPPGHLDTWTPGHLDTWTPGYKMLK